VANVTYKHLEGKTVVGLFSLGQWVQLLVGLVAGLVFGIYLSPLPPMPTIFLSCLLPGLPLAASYGAMGLEFSLAQGARAAWRFWRSPRRHLPGPGASASGYLVEADPDPNRRPAAGGERELEAGPQRGLGELWDA
jgi:hypothetical protein